MSHAKGPWKVRKDTFLQFFPVVETDNEFSLFICGNICGDSDSEVEANANLIAAAPELLEALELFRNYEGSRDNEGLRMLSIAHQKAKVAIKKAKG